MFNGISHKILRMAGVANLQHLNIRCKNNRPSQFIELSVSASDLRDMDTFSKSDPICILYTKAYGVKDWIEFGRTEMLKNTLNPKFVQKFKINYVFEEKTFIKFELYDVDKGSKLHKDLEAQDYLGDFECTLGKIVSCMEVTEPLKDSKTSQYPQGTITVTAEKQDEKSRENVTLQFRADNLKNVKRLGTISPYFILYKMKEDEDGYIPVYRSETKRKTTNPEWTAFTKSVVDICNAQKERLLRISVFDDGNGNDKEIGSTADLNLLQLMTASRSPRLELVRKRDDPKEKQKTSGTLLVHTGHISHQPNFLDFLQGGMEIKVSVAIDFTLSNGNPQEPNSLHYHSPNGLNPYARAIQSVLCVLEDYSKTKITQYAAFGFGAKNRHSGETMSLFQLNGEEENQWPCCDGVQGVFEAYYKALQIHDLYGPTDFAPIVNYVCRQALRGKPEKVYHILLILTDGNIDDMSETKKALVEAADAPMSVIIVGIGNEDFSAMIILDGDNKRLSYKNKQASRDIVQFVEFNNFDSQAGVNTVQSHSCLAQEVLKEVPDQVVSYMNNKGIRPRVSERQSVAV